MVLIAFVNVDLTSLASFVHLYLKMSFVILIATLIAIMISSMFIYLQWCLFSNIKVAAIKMIRASEHFSLVINAFTSIAFWFFLQSTIMKVIDPFLICDYHSFITYHYLSHCALSHCYYY